MRATTATLPTRETTMAATLQPALAAATSKRKTGTMTKLEQQHHHHHRPTQVAVGDALRRAAAGRTGSEQRASASTRRQHDASAGRRTRKGPWFSARDALCGSTCTAWDSHRHCRRRGSTSASCAGPGTSGACAGPRTLKGSLCNARSAPSTNTRSALASM